MSRKNISTHLPRSVQRHLHGHEAQVYPSYARISSLMERYQTKDLVGTDPASFRNTINRYLSMNDAAMEGYEGDTSQQRDLTIKFHWGHNHDFGEFALAGRMGSRHLSLVTTFVDEFGLPMSLEGAKVLDIGCWTGGTSLLFAAMGAQVVAIEEAKKYVDCLNYLRDAFALDGLEARNLSLYDLAREEEFQDTFDYVLCAGVLYHLSDPVLGLRITFNALKQGGKLLLETNVLPSRRRILSYKGPDETWGGSAEDLNRGGWNWFFPSPSTVHQMMRDVGFSDVKQSPVRYSVQGLLWGPSGAGLYAVGTKGAQVDLMRAGLSDRTIR